MDNDDLSKQVFGGILAAISNAVKDELGRAYGGSSLLSKLIEREVEKREPLLSSIIGDALDQAFGGDFRDKLRDAAAHKLARVLISKAEGEIEKRANELRSDASFRARLTLAIEQAIREC